MARIHRTRYGWRSARGARILQERLLALAVQESQGVVRPFAFPT
jgi:hypothetical protein